nr:putative reverse transcriptase domain-containing protein [Tanacetum cinerariifolium]
LLTRVLRIILEILPEQPSDTYVFTMKMEILLEPTSNKLLVGTCRCCSLVLAKSNSYCQAFNVKSLYGVIDGPKKSQVKLNGQIKFISSRVVSCIVTPGYVIEVDDGKNVEVNRIIRGCKLELGNSLFTIDLGSLGYGIFYVIVGMDWLSEHKAMIVCHEKLVRIPLATGEMLRIYRVKENQEKDKIGSKPDKNGKRVEAEKSLKQLQWVEQEKLSKTQKEWPKTQTQSKAIQVLKE